MKTKEKREFLLRKYAKEVECFPYVTSDGLGNVGKNSYICPLCLRIFRLAQLGSDINKYITLEHIPPENLGGKPLILTCKDCNSNCGHDLDVYLRNELEHREGKYFNDPKGYVSIFEYGGNSVNAILKEDENGIVNIYVENKHNHPGVVDRFIESTKDYDGDLEIPGFFKLGNHRRKTEVVDVAILKSAYLFAFYKFGYRYILSTNLNAIRKQILNPNEKKLPPFYLLLNESHMPDSIPDDVYSAAIDGEKVLVVILTFNLSSSNYLHRFATILPMPNTKDLDLYNRLKNISETKGEVEVEFVGIAQVG